MTELTTVIPVYNGERYIAETLKSVARQFRRPDRLIVLDNCSTDGTRQVVEQFRDMEFEWSQNSHNLGLFGNLNRALDFAGQTHYLHLLHADDLLKPEFYQRSMAALASLPGRSLSVCPAEFIDESSQLVSVPVPTRVAVPTETEARDFVAACTELPPIYFPGVLLKTAGQASPCQFRMDMPQLADQVFWANWAIHCAKIVKIPQALCQYRRHSGSDTTRNCSDLQTWVLDEWKAMELIIPLLDESGITRWLRKQKLKCLYAARAQVKIDLVKRTSPEFAQAIREAARRTAGPLHRALARLAVWTRKAAQPAPPH